jgi:hypothetical protein
MNFFYIERRKGDVKIQCSLIRLDTRADFVEWFNQLKRNADDFDLMEVRASCIAKIYDNSWPTFYPERMIEWKLPWPQ